MEDMSVVMVSTCAEQGRNECDLQTAHAQKKVANALKMLAHKFKLCIECIQLTVVIPRLTRAGAAPLLSQNETHEITTIKPEIHNN